VASLTDRERRLLRERVVFGLGIVQIADLHETSKSTVARWVTAARAKLVAAAHAYLVKTLDVGPDELRSLLDLATTGVQISVARILETRT
jgi:FixJ family two-component response regulator